ncbi:hypothetical protein B0H19DRAFT_1079629 [Mycena capillaripes]|nr:hypothetical protein B0H19DRAFT_1079629 [Mycena capillaripes]
MEVKQHQSLVFRPLPSLFLPSSDGFNGLRTSPGLALVFLEGTGGVTLLARRYAFLADVVRSDLPFFASVLFAFHMGVDPWAMVLTTIYDGSTSNNGGIRVQICPRQGPSPILGRVSASRSVVNKLAKLLYWTRLVGAIVHDSTPEKATRSAGPHSIVIHLLQFLYGSHSRATFWPISSKSVGLTSCYNLLVLRRHSPFEALVATLSKQLHQKLTQALPPDPPPFKVVFIPSRLSHRTTEGASDLSCQPQTQDRQRCSEPFQSMKTASKARRQQRQTSFPTN